MSRRSSPPQPSPYPAHRVLRALSRHPTVSTELRPRRGVGYAAASLPWVGDSCSVGDRYPSLCPFASLEDQGTHGALRRQRGSVGDEFGSAPPSGGLARRSICRALLRLLPPPNKLTRAIQLDSRPLHQWLYRPQQRVSARPCLWIPSYNVAISLNLLPVLPLFLCFQRKKKCILSLAPAETLSYLLLLISVFFPVLSPLGTLYCVPKRCVLGPCCMSTY